MEQIPVLSSIPQPPAQGCKWYVDTILDLWTGFHFIQKAQNHAGKWPQLPSLGDEGTEEPAGTQI